MTNSDKSILFHGSSAVVETPEIRVEKYCKDFGRGFYCTKIREQAVRWATRFGSGVLNEYEFAPSADLKTLSFAEMTEEWLDFIVACRLGKPHGFDFVEGPMANDTIFNYVQNFAEGKISREAFWALAKFKKPTHQLCFCTEKALRTLTFLGAAEVKK